MRHNLKNEIKNLLLKNIQIEMSIKGISPSLITTYETCSMQCYFDRIMKQKPDVPEWTRKLFGDAMHWFIAHYVYKKSNYPLGFKNKKNLLGFWHAFWQDVVDEKGELFPRPRPYWYREDTEDRRYYEDPEYLFKKGLGILSSYWDKNENEERPPYIEYQIKELLPETGIRLVGKIDQIRMSPDDPERHVVLDLKTGAGFGEDEGSTFHLNRDPQLTFYALLYRLHFSREEDSVGIYHLPTGKIHRTYRNDRDIAQVIESIKTISNDIQNERFKRTFGPYCRVCDYREPCYNPEEFFDGIEYSLDERDHDVIFREFASPPPELSTAMRRGVPRPNVKPHPIPKKPRQLRLKLRMKG
jgi:CRISPR/Cas system-associated exonuclease Cas4 (RecB family)